MARLLFRLALAVTALAASFAQLDRAARFAPGLAGAVPPALSGFAAEQRTRHAIAAQDGEAALAEAQALLARRPLPAEHLGLFAVAAAMAGEEDRSRAALELAMQRGWRDPLAQQAGAAAATSQGAHDIAAMRIAALYAIGEGEGASLYAAQLVSTAEGRAAFATRFATAGHWQRQVPDALSNAADPNDFAATMALASEAGATLDCARLERIATRYQREGHADAAQSLRETCAD